MRTSFALFIAATLAVSSCGGWRDSRANPRNWFGGSEEVALNGASAEEVNPLLPTRDSEGLFAKREAVDESVLVASVSGLRVERTTTGAIIYAEGLAAREGAHNVRLRAVPGTDDSVLTFQFRADYPGFNTPAGTELTRTVRAAASLSDGDLEGVRVIRVEGAQNAQETRRR